MDQSRDKSIAGIIAISLTLAAAYLLTRLPAGPGGLSEPTVSADAAIISSFNIIILLGWFSFGRPGGLTFSIFSLLASLFAVLRTGLYGHFIFVLPLVVATLAGYYHDRNMKKMKRDHALKLEKLAEEMNIIGNDERKREKSVAALYEKLARYATLKEVVEELSSVLSLDAVTRIISDKTLKILGRAGRLLIFVVDTRRQELMLSSSWDSRSSRKIKTKKGDIFDHWVFRHRAPLIIEDITRDFRFNEKDVHEAKEYFTSLISAPLVNEDKVVGILRMDNEKEKAYTQDDLRLLDILADLGAAAVQNAFLYSRIQELAIRDGLTGVFLRRFFLERLKEEIKRTSRRNGEFSLLMLDIDHFKEYNDRYGHTAGDLVLKHLARLVSASMREGDIASRYGGEEMAILIGGEGRKAAIRRAETLKKNIQTKPLLLRREEMTVTVSIGVASYPDDGLTEEDLIRVADERLYKAKNEGRNRVC